MHRSPPPRAQSAPAPDPSRLRAWQRTALERFRAETDTDFLAVATPGAGKTTFALSAVLEGLRTAARGRVVVVVPTQHLKVQWSEAAEAFGLHLDPDWSQRGGALASDAHGVVVTYQQVATSAKALRSLAHGAFVVLDEVHHAADTRAWGDALRLAFQGAARRLCLSGTPFRSDTHAIPFVRYEGEVARPHYEYSYGDALADANVVRPVYFPRVNGQMEWEAPDGTFHSQTFDDPLDRARSAQRLRTALSAEGEWLAVVIERAHRRLLALRGEDPSAAGIVVAMDQDHARAIASILRDHLRVAPVVATSDDPEASERIGAFRSSRAPWIVAVRMVSEGVDIPRLRVGVYATTTTTEFFFRQVVGRLVRWVPGMAGRGAYLFLPDDPTLRRWAEAVREQRRHSLEKRIRRGAASPFGDPEDAERGTRRDGPRDAQMSLFAPISAVPLDERGVPLEALPPLEPGDAAPPGTGDDGAATGRRGGGGVEPDDDAQAVRDELALYGAPGDVGVGDVSARGPAVPARPRRRVASPGPVAPSLRDRKRELRMLNSDRARTIARLKGLTHAEVNVELNRLAGIRRVTEASEAELERRLAAANAWIARA